MLIPKKTNKTMAINKKNGHQLRFIMAKKYNKLNPDIIKGKNNTGR